MPDMRCSGCGSREVVAIIDNRPLCQACAEETAARSPPVFWFYIQRKPVKTHDAVEMAAELLATAFYAAIAGMLARSPLLVAAAGAVLVVLFCYGTDEPMSRSRACAWACRVMFAVSAAAYFWSVVACIG